ncbi:uncharacterized protein LOC131943650 isoform X2 [Physella acuta]|nr:uncharacterized protein LOC131943650 isoform X2 [Physella acuta]
MERSSVESKRPKVASFWLKSRDTGGVELGHAEYIARLTSLRDSLLDQEQVYLAQALDRLRLHSLTSKSSSYRLKFTGDDTVKRSGPVAQGRNLLTTVEKFRQMRPRPHYPTIAPLQGTPLLEQIPVRTKQIPDTSSHFGADPRQSREIIQHTPRSANSKLDETVQANLQRLIQPTSSIPNVGRKSVKVQEQLEVRPRQLPQLRSRAPRPAGRQMVSPYLPAQSLTTQGLSPLSLSPYSVYTSSNHALHVKKGNNQENTDLELSQNFSYDYYVSRGSLRRQESDDDDDVIDTDKSRHDTHSERKLSRRYNTPNTSFRQSLHSIPHTSQTVKPLIDTLPTPRVLEPEARNTISVFLPDQSSQEISGFTFYNSDQDSDDERELTPNHGDKITHDDDPVQSRTKTLTQDDTDSFKHNDSTLHDELNKQSPTHLENYLFSNVSKSNMDAPDIVLKPATPLPGFNHLTHEERADNAFVQSVPNLTKTMKQKELRKKELQNLFEDVKELTQRVEHIQNKE